MSKTAASTPDDGPEPKGKLTLLKAIELITAKPEKIKKETDTLLRKYRKRYKEDRTDDDIKELVAHKVIQNYSYMAAFSGGATALAGVIPGLGTVISVAGGATGDIALCMKFQIEMVMAIANIYDHDILVEEEKRVCFFIAGLGAINQAGQQGTKEVGSKAFTKMAQQFLKGPTLVAVKEIFKKVGISFTRKSLEKAIPFGVGVVVGFSVNKTLTWYVGVKARDFFQTN
jgi:hypothetical protein